MAQAPSVEQWEQARDIIVSQLTAGGMDPEEADDLAAHALAEAGFEAPGPVAGPAPPGIASQVLE